MYNLNNIFCLFVLLKWAILDLFSLFYCTIKSKWKFPMAGFKLQVFGVGSESCTNCATAIALDVSFFLCYSWCNALFESVYFSSFSIFFIDDHPGLFSVVYFRSFPNDSISACLTSYLCDQNIHLICRAGIWTQLILNHHNHYLDQDSRPRLRMPLKVTVKCWTIIWQIYFLRLALGISPRRRPFMRSGCSSETRNPRRTETAIK